MQIPNRICTGMNYLQALYSGAFVESEFCEIRIDPHFGVFGVPGSVSGTSFGGFLVFFSIQLPLRFAGFCLP